MLVRAPWLGVDTGTADLFTPAVVPAHPAALALACSWSGCSKRTPVRFAAATVLAPASEFGRRRDGRAAPADREPAEFPGAAAGHL